MAIARFPIVNAVDPEHVGGGVIQDGASNLNVLYSRYPDGRVYATQRGAISLRDTVDSSVTPARARGICFWDKNNLIYFVVDGKVYQGGYATPLVQEIAPGKDPVYFLEMGDYLILLDPEGNEGWYIHADNPAILLRIDDGDFPGNQAGKSIAGGGVVLDGFLFVMDTDGIIWNSEINDPTSWSGIDFIGTEREEDTGIYLTKHHDNIVALGAKSVEFFYNAGNPVASPLQRRADVSYRTGPVDRKSVCNTGERIYFIGSEVTGTIGFYGIESFKMSKLSDDSIDLFLNNTRSRSKFDFNLTGGQSGSHHLIYITSLSEEEDEEGRSCWIPEQTLVYNGSVRNFPSLFETDAGNIRAFGLVQVTERGDTDNREGRLLFFSGDIGVYDLITRSKDTSGTPPYMDEGYLVNQDDYILDIGEEEEFPIEMELILEEKDFDILTNKFCHRLSVVGTSISSGEGEEPLFVSWSDDHYRSWSNPRPLSTRFNRSLTRTGTFKRRAHRIQYSGTDPLRLEFLEFDVRASQYA